MPRSAGRKLPAQPIMKVSLTDSDLPIIDFKDVLGGQKKVANIKATPVAYAKRNHGSLLVNQTGGKLFRMPSTDLVQIEVRNKVRSTYTGLS